MEIPKQVQSYAIWVSKKIEQGYPNALIFGLSFPYTLAGTAVERRNQEDFTPAFLVADNILDTTGTFSFIETMKFRNHEKTGKLAVDHEEVQGYVDVISLYTCCSAMESQQSWGEVPIEFFFENSPALKGLPENITKSAIIFVYKYATWVRQQIKIEDIVDGRNITQKIAAMLMAQPKSASYKRGVQTANDTFTVYSMLVNSIITQYMTDHGELGNHK